MIVNELIRKNMEYAEDLCDCLDAADPALTMLATRGIHPFAHKRLNAFDYRDHSTLQNDCLCAIRDGVAAAIEAVDNERRVQVVLCGPAARLQFNRMQTRVDLLAIIPLLDTDVSEAEDDGKRHKAPSGRDVEEEKKLLRRLCVAVEAEVGRRFDRAEDAPEGAAPPKVRISGVLLRAGKTFFTLPPLFEGMELQRECSYPIFEEARLLFEACEVTALSDGGKMIADEYFGVSSDIANREFPTLACCLNKYLVQSTLLRIGNELRGKGQVRDCDIVNFILAEPWSAAINVITLHLLFLAVKVRRKPFTKEEIRTKLGVPPIGKVLSVVPKLVKDILTNIEDLVKDVEAGKRGYAKELVRHLDDATRSFEGAAFPLWFSVYHMLASSADPDALGDPRSVQELREIGGELARVLNWTQELSELVVSSTLGDPTSARKKLETLLGCELFLPPHETVSEPIRAMRSMIPEKEMPTTHGKDVFIVHGHDEAAKLKAARLVERLNLKAVILSEQPSDGMTIIEKFEEYSDVRYALVLLTPDDVGGLRTSGDTKPRARQNVILELGFFIGRLGREKVCALHKSDVEIPSDYSGVVYVEMDEKDAWRVKVANEMKNAGLPVDLNLL